MSAVWIFSYNASRVQSPSLGHSFRRWAQSWYCEPCKIFQHISDLRIPKPKCDIQILHCLPCLSPQCDKLVIFYVCGGSLLEHWVAILLIWCLCLHSYVLLLANSMFPNSNSMKTLCGERIFHSVKPRLSFFAQLCAPSCKLICSLFKSHDNPVWTENFPFSKNLGKVTIQVSEQFCEPHCILHSVHFGY